MILFDTHTHLLDEQFEEDRNRVLSALPEAGVGYIVEAAASEEDFPRIYALTALYPFVYGAVGIHPQCAREMTEATARRMRQALTREKTVAVGEIGLDYHYDFSPRDVQKRVFIEQLGIAREVGKPVILHDREAHGDMMDILTAHRDGLSGVMHCYSGSYEDAVRYIDMGLYIAFGGALTFHNAAKQRDIAARLPFDRLLIETDCPYMAPVPLRGTRNDPRNVRITLSALASVRGVSEEEAARITTENAKRLFGILDPQPASEPIV